MNAGVPADNQMKTAEESERREPPKKRTRSFLSSELPDRLHRYMGDGRGRVPVRRRRRDLAPYWSITCTSDNPYPR
jgi:hypothetical protein